MRRLRRSFAGDLAAAIVCLGLARLAVAHTAPMDPAQIVRASKQVVVAIVQSARPHWNRQRNLIVTDYVLEVEDGLKGNPSSSFTITIPGGTVDGETHRTCVTVDLEEGGRYLLFLEDPSRPTLTPITGAAGGAFQEISETPDTTAVRPAQRQRGVIGEDGRSVSFRDFVAKMRALIAEVEARPAVEPTSVVEPQVAGNLPGKMYSPRLEAADSSRSEAPAAFEPPEEPRRVVGADDELLGARRPETTTAGATAKTPAAVYRHRATPPIVFNPFPASFTPWAGRDQAEMSYWNSYAGDLFRVLAVPTGTWAWGNGQFDIAGFQPDSVMQSQFGQVWGTNQLAITFFRFFGDGPIIEADIALNANVSWTTDLVYSTRGDNSVWGFDVTMLHELGHSWGLTHPWESQEVWWDSVMNYPPKEFRFPTLYADDVLAIRSAFPGISIHDGALSFYTTAHDPGSPPPSSAGNPRYIPSYPNPSTVPAGGTFTFGQPFKLENTGTDPIINPAIEVYLTPARVSWANAIYLGTLKTTITIPPGTVQSLLSPPIRVPSTVPRGSYFIGLFFRDDAAAKLPNKAAWSNWNVMLTVGQAPLPQPSAAYTVFGATLNPATGIFEGEIEKPITFTAGELNASAWTWDFGDGTPGSGRSVTKTYANAGSVTVRLTVAGNSVQTVGSATASIPLWLKDPKAVYLIGGRFKVRVDWRAPAQGTSGSGNAVALTGDTGYFWFFNASNVELIVKILDGRATNGNFWVFYGALSDVEYTITVMDTATGLTRTYFNPSGTVASIADVAAFKGAPDSEYSATSSGTGAAWSGIAADRFTAKISCTPDASAVCLNDARFRARVTWRVPSRGASGIGNAVALTSDTGYYWFFDGANIELVLKVIDGRSINGQFWVFCGALSDVEYTITVTDTVTGNVKTYFNPSGRLGSVVDTAAFAGR